LPRTSEALYLLQRVRDEAHRFAITYHRQRRSRSMTASALDGVPGLGDTRRKALLRHFGSVKKLRAATVEDIVEVPGVGPATAASVVAALHADEPVPAFDPRTGEVLDDRSTVARTRPGTADVP
ncbi:MAG TPA: helix-hairpin-helix domain-containing protein, partial [Mycobacteriales bacterium]